MPKLNIIVGSTRPGRAGLAVASWFVNRARCHGHFESELVDLAALNLPMLDEPKHPRLPSPDHAAAAVLDELARWHAALRPLRAA